VFVLATRNRTKDSCEAFWSGSNAQRGWQGSADGCLVGISKLLIAKQFFEQMEALVYVQAFGSKIPNDDGDMIPALYGPAGIG
jgi:hypothetical protein